MSYSTVILAEPALQSYWKLNEASGNALDSKDSVQGTLAASGPTLPVQKAAGLLWNDTDAAYYFTNGANIDFGIVYLFAGTAAMSVECWFSADEPLQVGVNKDLVNNSIGANGGWRLTVSGPSGGSGVQFLRVSPGGANDEIFSGTLPVPSGSIWHVVGTYDGTNMNLYLNGAAASAPLASSRSLTGGSNSLLVSSGGNPWSGTIDEVAIYNTALTRQQVQNHYTAGASGGVILDPMSVSPAIRN